MALGSLYTAGNVMDSVASLMNDTAKQTYTYVVVLPYLGIALQDLKKILELNNSPVTNSTPTVITVPAGTAVIGFATNPKLPANLIEIQELWQRQSGVDPFIPMNKVEYLPHYLEDIPLQSFLDWAWQGNAIHVIPANQNIDIKIDAIIDPFTGIVDATSFIEVINADSYLQYRTAALCAQFIGENASRAQQLNGEAQASVDNMIGIENKGKQASYTRRRPFRAAWKQRGTW